MYMKYAIGVLLACFISILVYLPVALAQEEIEVTDIETSTGRPYQVGDGGLEIGTTYYIDRDYVVNAMPEELEGATWIMTGNDDKQAQGEDFLKFTVDPKSNRLVVVWVARDSRGDEGKGGTPPEWLSEDNGWERHGDMLVEVTDGNMGHFVLWSKEFEKGEVVLGGNADPGAAGQDSNYIVLLTLGEDLAVEPLGKLNTTWAGLKSER